MRIFPFFRDRITEEKHGSILHLRDKRNIISLLRGSKDPLPYGGKKMNFKLTKQQEHIRSMVREFAEKEVAPLAKQIDIEARFPTKPLKKQQSWGSLGCLSPKNTAAWA